MSKSTRKFSLALGFKRFIPTFTIALVAILGSEYLRQEELLGGIYIDALLLFCGVLIAQIIARIS